MNDHAPSSRHGGLTLALVLLLLLALLLGSVSVAAASEPEYVTPVQSRVFEIDYHVPDSALPLSSVQLWYTFDHGSEWHLYGIDDDAQAPMSFSAPAEGLYAFYFILENQVGRSGPAPGRNTEPHAWAYVDFTPPVVQMHPPRQGIALGRPLVQIRWSAVDAHFDRRPISLEYRRLPEKQWQPLTTRPIANTGRYDWTPPEGLAGPVEIRLAALDRGGHRAEANSSVLELLSARELALRGAAESSFADSPNNGASAAVVTAAARERARKLQGEALELDQQGQTGRAISKLREAASLDPTRPEVFALLGSMLYRIDDYDRSLEAYELALRMQPDLRRALLGAAMVDRQLQQYGRAAQRLRQVLDRDREDVETWMYLGDLAVFQGDEISAREYYLLAASLDPEATTIVAEARKRLELLDQSSQARRNVGG
jgi:tetratricopeptide (TPR) repeat protein